MKVRTGLTTGQRFDALEPKGQKVRRKPQRREDALQRQFWETIQRLGVHRRCLAFHVPNGGKMTPKMAQHLKAMGMVPGVSDFIFMWDKHPFRAAVEFKDGKNKLTPAQERFRDHCVKLDVPFYECRSLDEAMDALVQLEILRPGRTKGAYLLGEMKW